jgi:hypothetical protein
LPSVYSLSFSLREGIVEKEWLEWMEKASEREGAGNEM